MSLDNIRNVVIFLLYFYFLALALTFMSYAQEHYKNYYIWDNLESDIIFKTQTLQFNLYCMS